MEGLRTLEKYINQFVIGSKAYSADIDYYDEYLCNVTMLCICSYKQLDYYDSCAIYMYLFPCNDRYKIFMVYSYNANISSAPESLNEFKTIHLRDLMEIIKYRSSKGYEINDTKKREFSHDISIILQL